MMLAPFCCSILKVSVATRYPLMKTPNEPESTIWAGAGFALSFLSTALAAGKAAKAEAKTRATAPWIRVSNFTRLLLVPCARRFCLGRALPQFRWLPFPLIFPQFQIAWPSHRTGAAFCTVLESDSRCSATASGHLGPSAQHNVAKAPAAVHPGKPLGCHCLGSPYGSPVVRMFRHLRRRF